MFEKFIEENGMVLISADKFESLILEENDARELYVKLEKEVGNCKRLKQAIMQEYLSKWNLEHTTLENLIDVDCAYFGFERKVGKLLSLGITLQEMVLFLTNAKNQYDAECAKEVNHE